uniref:Uncharacterized protein n=1 Tax=Candidatus Kentrum sp. SD TaxID=2126332 RepID=A0A451BNN0_9GAMM|nr:MAG: hypothetical protein BECKSD772D_GA0070982_10714 [Candidatus Kentron sp. SD]
MKSAMFDEEYLDSLTKEPILALWELANRVLKKWNYLLDGMGEEEDEDEDFDFFLEAFAIIQVQANNIDGLWLDIPSLEGKRGEICQTIIDFCESAKDQVSGRIPQLKAAQFRNKYQARFGNIFAYEFSEGDLKKIQTLINELRDAITASDLFEENHRQRLLARLEKIQSELHKKMADLDRFWGLVGDAGVVLGKFGENAKPFVDRIREITNIV